MAARIIVIAIAVSLLHIADTYSRPPKPYNVTVVSFNMGAVLKWDIPEYSFSNVTYTAQIRELDELRTICNHTGEQWCDVGELPSCFGAYDFRVRAEYGAKTSKWAEIPHNPAKDTIIGPPTVAVEVKAEAVEVVITDPVLRVSTPLTKCYSRVTYVLQYWRMDRHENVMTVVQKVDVTEKRLRLELLDDGTSYCVQARVHIPPYGLEGLFSEPICDPSDIRSLPPTPLKVKVVSFNMGAVLKWDIPEYSFSNVTYTAQMRDTQKPTDFQTVCNHTGEQWCDVGELPSCFGAYDFRVRAEYGAKTSKWAEIPHIPAKDTIIGPPTVAVEVKAEAVEVVITDPVLRVSTPLTKCYSRVTYVLKYWRMDRHDNVMRVVEKANVTGKRIQLGLIDTGISYCVQARVHIPLYGLEGLFSKPICDQSGGDKPSRPLVVSLVLVSLALPLALLIGWFIHKGNRFFTPETNLPPLFKKHLLEANITAVNNAGLQATALSQEKYDKISWFHEENSYCEVVFKQSKPCDCTGNVEDSDELTHYCNVLTLSHSSYRNI